MIELIIALAVTIVSAYLAVSSTNIGLGVVYFMMGAPTVALFQVAIFAGAVVVFFVITVMFTQSGTMTTDDVETEVQE